MCGNKKELSYIEHHLHFENAVGKMRFRYLLEGGKGQLSLWLREETESPTLEINFDNPQDALSFIYMMAKHGTAMKVFVSRGIHRAINDDPLPGSSDAF